MDPLDFDNLHAVCFEISKRQKVIMMKAAFLFLAIILLYSCKTVTPRIPIYQTDDYNGIKKIDEFFIRDSLLFFFSNGDMSGCLIDVLKYSHASDDTSYFKIEKRSYSLLYSTKQSKNIQDSIEFSVQEFCRYNSFYLEELIVNEKLYKLVDNKVKVSKEDIFKKSTKGIAVIKFYNLGTYVDSCAITEKDSAVNIFFHLNTSSSFRRKMYNYSFAKIPMRNSNKKSIIIGDETIVFRKVRTTKSYFNTDFLQ